MSETGHGEGSPPVGLGASQIDADRECGRASQISARTANLRRAAMPTSGKTMM